MFLKPSTAVIPALNQDYYDWHLGREYYSLWYLEIQNPEVLSYLTELRRQFADILYVPNTRQFHITLFICGFFEALNTVKAVSNDNFSVKQLNQQLQQLKHLPLSSIQLRTGKINSFDSALFVEVEDDFSQLAQVRECLNQHQQEIAPIIYCPHITLGLYRQAWPSEVIFERIAKVEQQPFALDFQQLIFGSYQAQLLQGPLSVYHYYSLMDKAIIQGN